MNNNQKVGLFWVIIYAAVITMVIVAALSSCRSTRGYGCPGQGSGLGYVGYK